jgi:hypothetical protein
MNAPDAMGLVFLPFRSHGPGLGSILFSARNALARDASPTDAALFLGLSNIDHAGFAEVVHAQAMASEAITLTREEFDSLLAVGNTPVHGSAPAIPAAHAARLIALGYMVDLEGRLRMTTPGRFRIYAGQIADGLTSLDRIDSARTHPFEEKSPIVS